MKSPLRIAALVILAVFCSCATSRPPQAFHNADGSALVIKSLNTRSGQIIAPTQTDEMENARMLDQIKSVPQRQTAIVILENYLEPQLGPEFRNRSMTWFFALRVLGFQHIVFLQGRGVPDPNGLITLAEYD
jgi:hypothetical protein